MSTSRQISFNAKAFAKSHNFSFGLISLSLSYNSMKHNNFSVGLVWVYTSGVAKLLLAREIRHLDDKKPWLVFVNRVRTHVKIFPTPQGSNIVANLDLALN